MYCNHKLSKYTWKNKTKLHKIKYTYYKNMVGGFNSVPINFIQNLDLFIKQYNEQAEKFNLTVTNPKEKKKIIDPSHGLEHALMVLCHAKRALDAYKQTNPSGISEQEELNVKLAALLHDTDDSKYFPNNKNFENAKHILTKSGLDEENINEIIKMISWVSASKNGDRIPKEVSTTGKDFLLYPRYADRLEALGIIGLERTLDYTLSQGAPLCIEQEPKLNYTIEQIYEHIATPTRYKCYKGASRSMMDHFYDKLLLLGKYPISNLYFDSECANRQKPLEDIAVKFEQSGHITEAEVREYIEVNRHIGSTCSCNHEVFDYMRTNSL